MANHQPPKRAKIRVKPDPKVRFIIVGFNSIGKESRVKSVTKSWSHFVLAELFLLGIRLLASTSLPNAEFTGEEHARNIL